MTDPYEAKYEEMQKYVPFIQKVIEKLKLNNNDNQTDNPRKTQLQKMEMLHDLLTNKQKKIKVETLLKCEGVLIKLQTKIEKQANTLLSEDSVLGDIKMQHQTKDTKYEEDILGPASPPPEAIPVDDIDQPVVIPTERRCSPILVKETTKGSADKQQHQLKIETIDPTKHGHDSKNKNFQNSKQKGFDVGCKPSNSKLAVHKENPCLDKTGSFHRNTNYNSLKSARHDHNHGKESQHHKHFKQQSSQNSHASSKEINTDVINKSNALEQKLQTVKVVITEPLPAHFKKQHFPPTSKFLPRSSSVCHNNLKPLHQTSQGRSDNNNDAYSPEELWDQFNESKTKLSNAKTPSTAPVFSRLGEKVFEEPQKSKTPGRYTPIPDVLKSPPLSVTDINNLLLESGSEKTLEDISEIGTRRPPKIEEPQKKSDIDSFEFVRKKLAQTAKFNSPQRENNNHNISPLPSERVALKYNPHPRQERLQSVSSTDSSECSIQSKFVNPTISQRSPSHPAAINVNVLPAINLSDPRLKRQSTPLSPPPERKSLLPTPPTLIPSQNVGLSNQNPMIYSRRKDPRISRITNSTVPTAPFRRMSTNQPQFTPEENWDSDEGETVPKSGSGYERSNENFDRSYCDGRNMGPTVRDTFNQTRLQTTGQETETATTSKQFSQFNTNLKQVPQREQNVCKTKKSKSNLIAATTYVVPNAPKSDSEEDWDAEPETTNFKAKPPNTDTTQSPTNIAAFMPVLSPYQSQISPKTLVVSPKPILHPAHMPHIPHTPHVPHIPHVSHIQQQQQQQYPMVGSSHNIQHSYRVQNPQQTNRFNCLLNDTSERMKYFEAKKQKSAEPRTYKEFREAKERALAQEAAMKLAAQEAEAKKRSNELKELHNSATAKTQSVNEQKIKLFDGVKRVEDCKNDKKPPLQNAKKCTAVESTLDKMYRTQNFNTSFPKANTSFKIPKKKIEDKIKQEPPIKPNEVTPSQGKSLSSEKLKLEEKEKVQPNQIETASGRTQCDKQEPAKKQHTKKYKRIDTNKLYGMGEKDNLKVSTESPSSQKDSLQKPTKSSIDKTVNEIKSEKISGKKHSEKEKKEVHKDQLKENLQEQHLPENDMTMTPEDQLNARDPRCRPKTTPTPLASENCHSTQQAPIKTLGDIVITSLDNQVVLKPQQNLEKFNKLTQQLSSKPQRILQRRNTMVVFDSAPLVDKEKLRKANALLFEDVQEEEKRKHKQAEEERLMARRNKILEEMFKKTDDNCTVSTQNIITGKRRTRATVNFNETANARNVFKHLTIKDSSTENVISSPANSHPARSARSNFKIKMKNLPFVVSKRKDEDSDDDKPLNRISQKATESHDSKAKTLKGELLEGHQKSEESEIETKTNIKLAKKLTATGRKCATNAENSELNFTPIQNEEHQNCAVSSTSTDNYNVEDNTCSSTSTHKSYKRETDDNEPTSTAGKSNNPTPTPTSTPEPNEPILREIVDQILKPNSNREPILAILAQILSEEKLALIKSLIESSNKQNADEQATNEMEDTNKPKSNTQNTSDRKESSRAEEDEQQEEEEEEELEDRKPIISSRADEIKKNTIPKKKRSELDRLNEDIRDMFICNGVLTATGRRMCTIMGKDVASTSGKQSSKESTSSVPIAQHDNCNKKKSTTTLKPPNTARTLRRSTRSCKATEDNEDNESILSRTTEDSIDDFNSTTDTAETDVTPLRRMPVLKPHTPIKIPDDDENDVSPKAAKPKEASNKRKSDSKIVQKAKKTKTAGGQVCDSEPDEKNSDTETDKAEDRETNISKKDATIKNTNIHWHNQSKYTTWCMICEKRIPANASSIHYKMHHRENYISRMAPVILQQYKQGKLSKPLFGVKRAQKQPSWFYRCPFCLKYFNTALPLWLEHFQNHTVEFRYECSKCFRSSNKKLTITRHIKSCKGATVLTSVVKPNMPNVINAHVCHLCNFIQLKRVNLERHYIEQHQSDKETVDLLGYTIKLFDVDNVECVSEGEAAEKEKEVWKSIEENAQVIDIDDDEEAGEKSSNRTADKVPETDNETCLVENQIDTKDAKSPSAIDASSNKVGNQKTQNEHLKENKQKAKIIREANEGALFGKINADLNKTTDVQAQKEDANKSPTHQRQNFKTNVPSKSNDSQSSDFEMVDQQVTAQDIQDELLALAAKVAEREKGSATTPDPLANDQENVTEPTVTSQQLPNAISTSINDSASEAQTSVIYNKNNASSEPRKLSQAASNVFMPTRDETNYSPTIQILAQSIINIDEHENPSLKEKPITMAERLSQRFKDLQSESTAAELANSNSPKTALTENAFEKLIDETLFELTKAKDSAANKSSSNITPAAVATATAASGPPASVNVFDKLFNDTVLGLEKDDLHPGENDLVQQPVEVPTEPVTVISDDEDWEDIEITETAPAVSSTTTGNMQKTKSKGMFQKFGMFKGSNAKSKKLMPPLIYLPKKKSKEKSAPAATVSHTPTITTVTAAAAAVSASKTHDISNTTTASNSNAANIGFFKPVINMMDGLFPDSPCNDPIDLVPELAPLEPLQDLNDISSILDSNLSAVNINAADNHTSIEDALDFVSEQQANDKQKLNPSTLTMTQSLAKTTINNISHVGFSVQNAAENSFKFYCLLQNCSFLYSSDSIGLEAHFMCEHSEIKWNGYCLMCQSQNLTNDANADAIGEYSISKEIRHMMEKHANNLALDLNTDSTQHSNSSIHEAEGRPKIKLRRLTGDCLSRATPENLTPSTDIISTTVAANISMPQSMLGALLVADPKPPTKEMPPQPQMPLTEPLLLDKSTDASRQLPFTNVNRDFLITSVTSADPQTKQNSLQISNVVSLNNNATASVTGPQQIQIPKISSVRTLAPKAGGLWADQIESEPLELAEAAAESLEVSRILQNAGNPSTNREGARTENDSPVLVAETVPIGQSKTGDFVVTQTLLAQYNEFSSTALDFNISIAASTVADDNNTNTNTAATTSGSTSSASTASIASRQYKCMGVGCKFVSRVPVAMSDHLRFHERRNFSNKQDYLACGFCFYCASDVDDYMNHANQFHIVSKGPSSNTTPNESDTASSLTKKIHNILNSKNCSSGQVRNTTPGRNSNQAKQVQDSQEVYIKKLRTTIEEIVAPTGLSDDKLYRCVIKNCHSQLTENTFLNHTMYHISTTGANPNNYVYKCPHCTAQYHRAAGIKAHIKNHARNRYFCYLCDETSTNPGQLLKHFSEKHWHTLNMYTKELLPPKSSPDGSDSALDSNYYVSYTQDLSAEEVRKFGEKLILEWQRKKCGSKTHFKSSEIDLLPLSAIFQRQVNCGECEYKTKVRTNMFRHLLMHKQNPGGLANKTGASSVVDPVNPVPCLNSNERFFDKMTNLASSSLIPSSSVAATTKPSFKLPQAYVEETKRYVCGCQNCNYHTNADELFRTHILTVHSSEMAYTCPFCKEEVCKRGISFDRIMNHSRFHGVTIYRCDECNYFHHLRYVVERHVNEKHSTMKVNIVTHVRSNDNSIEGTMLLSPFAGKRYNAFEGNLQLQAGNTANRSASNESSVPKPIVTIVTNYTKGKPKWECDVCGHKAATVGQMQTHCQQQHSVKNQYKCAHCNFGSQQLSQILHHIDDKHSGKAREARTVYHKIFNNNDEVADTRPLWQRNDPTRVRHIRGILMEDEEESEEYRKKLALSEDADDDSNEDQYAEVEENEDLNAGSYISGYEFACYHCSFKTQTFEELKEQHYSQNHNFKLETAKPFWYRLHRRLCCPECRSFLGNYNELQQHLQTNHKKRFYAADIKMAENDDTSHRILCGYCSFHCANADNLYRHHLKAQHWPQDIRIDNNEQIMEILGLGKPEVSYQCTICADLFSNQVAIVQHACNSHAGEDSFSYRELSNSLIYRCNSCCFTSTVEMELLRHTIDHYSRFRVCSFCQETQSSFNAYMQHCYAEHKSKIGNFRTIYPFTEIRKFLLQTLVIFPSGLVLNKRNLLNTKYGNTYIIDNLYEEIYRISQQPPIPRLSIARLVARKSIEAQQKSVETSPSSSSIQDDVFDAMQSRPNIITKRRCTVAFDHESNHSSINSNSPLHKRSTNTIEGKTQSAISKRRMTNDHHDQQVQQLTKQEEFSVPLKAAKISKRRRTVAVDRDTSFSSNLTSSSNSLLTELSNGGRKRKSSLAAHTQTATPTPKHMHLDMEPFSFYGKKPEIVDLSKIYTKVAIGGIKTPLTVDKFKLLFNIDCQLKLTKCDEDSQLLAYSDYKHIKKACPASEKLKYD